MLSRRAFCAGATVGLFGCAKRRGSGFPGYAFVANEEGQAVAAVDLTAFAVAKHIRIDGSPTAVIARPSRPEIYALTPANGTLHHIRVDTLAFARQLRVTGTALSMRLSHDGEAVYVLGRDRAELVNVSLNDFRVRWRTALPTAPFDFEVAPNGEVAAVSYGRAGSIQFLALGEHGSQPGKPVVVSAEVGMLRFLADSKLLIAANRSDRALSIYDVASQGLMVQLPLAVRPDNLYFDAHSSQLFVTGEGQDAVVIVYPYHTPQVAKTVLAGHAPGAMAASANPDYLFITNPQSGTVTILDISTGEVIAVTQVGSDPGYVAITPNNEYALVLNRRSGDIAVLYIPPIKPYKFKSTARLFTMIPVGSRPVSAVVRAV